MAYFKTHLPDALKVKNETRGQTKANNLKVCFVLHMGLVLADIIYSAVKKF